jgi:hypothetical protein
LAVGSDLHELVPRSQEEGESWVVVHCLLSDLHDLARALLVEILPEHGEQNSLDAVDLLDDQHFSEPDGQLESGVELSVLVVEYLHRAFALE